MPTASKPYLSPKPDRISWRSTAPASRPPSLPSPSPSRRPSRSILSWSWAARPIPSPSRPITAPNSTLRSPTSPTPLAPSRSRSFVDQFEVLTSDPPAQFGRSSGGVLTIVTKTGTNHLHGDVYEFLRNDQLDAANFFTKRSGVFPIPSRHHLRLPHQFNRFGDSSAAPSSCPGCTTAETRPLYLRL